MRYRVISMLQKTVKNGHSSKELAKDDIVIITREELTTLVQAAVQNLKNSEELDVSPECKFIKICLRSYVKGTDFFFFFGGPLPGYEAW